MVLDLYESHRETRDNIGIKDETRNLVLVGVFNENLSLEEGPTQLNKREIGTAFILGHSTNGILGTSKLGFGTMGSWAVQRVVNPKNTFHEHFRYDTYNDSTNTNGDFSTTYYNASMDKNEVFQTLDIFKDNKSIQYATIYVDLTGTKKIVAAGSGLTTTLIEGQ